MPDLQVGTRDPEANQTWALPQRGPVKVCDRTDKDTKPQQRMSRVGGGGVEARELWEQRVMEPKRRRSKTATRRETAVQAEGLLGSKAWRLK